MGTDAALQLPLRKVHDVLKLSNSCVPFQHMILMVESCPMPFCRFGCARTFLLILMVESCPMPFCRFGCARTFLLRYEYDVLAIIHTVHREYSF
jgi:hypothetical protein